MERGTKNIFENKILKLTLGKRMGIRRSFAVRNLEFVPFL
jgi:hypothetical protein